MKLKDERKELIYLALSQNNLSALTEAASNLLQNPLAVYDCGYYILSHSSLDGIDDQKWIEGMRRKYCLYEYAALFNHIARSSDSDSQMIDNFGKYRRRMSVLRMGENIIGYYSLIECKTPFEEVPEDNYDLVAKLLAKEVSNSYKSIDTPKLTNYHRLLPDILNGQFANENLLMQRLKDTDLDQCKKFRIITVEMDSYNGQITDRESIHHHFKKIFPSSWTAIYEHTIIILLNGDSKECHSADSFHQLSEYLSSIDMNGCISNEFDNLFQLKTIYQNNLDILRLAHELNNNDPFIETENFKLLKIVSLIDRKDLHFICSSAVLDIYYSDVSNGTNNLDTLFAYLHFGKSLKKASEFLFIHRNTITYRINKMCETFHLDLENEQQIVLIYVSCMMVYYHLYGNREKLRKLMNATPSNHDPSY